MVRKIRKKPIGFTLSELLIALAILGVIATFTIPKVLQSQQDNKRDAVLKETISTLNAVFYAVDQQNLVTANTDLSVLFTPSLNYLKSCPTNSNAEGCWNSGVMGDPSGGIEVSDSLGFILHNGTYIAGLGQDANDPTANTSGAGVVSQFMIDWNGTAPPNAEGQDQLWLLYCFESTPCSRPATFSGNGRNNVYPNSDASVPLYEKLFSK